MKKLRVIVLMHEDLVPPKSIDGLTDEAIQPWKSEYDVLAGLEHLGHDVRPLGVSSDLGVMRDAIVEWKPDIAFNLLEEFHGISVYDQHVISYLELMRQPYTGCNPRGLMLAHDKALSKKIMAYHRILTPKFVVVPLGSTVKLPHQLSYPLVVKSLTEEASLGIAQASIVTSEARLKERVAFVHEQLKTDVIVEQYIEGRELYVSILGSLRLQTLPIWEMLFTKMPEQIPHIATAKVKWDFKYQKKHGIITQAAKDLPPGAETQIARLCKRVYRVLNQSGYSRIDLRMTAEGQVYVLEANPNPNLAYGEDFAESAEACGIKYEPLLQRILNLGLAYPAAWKAQL